MDCRLGFGAKLRAALKAEGMDMLLLCSLESRKGESLMLMLSKGCMRLTERTDCGGNITKIHPADQPIPITSNHPV